MGVTNGPGPAFSGLYDVTRRDATLDRSMTEFYSASAALAWKVISLALPLVLKFVAQSRSLQTCGSSSALAPLSSLSPPFRTALWTVVVLYHFFNNYFYFFR